MDPTSYWYMFPIALGIATLGNATGIEGETFFSPVFILLLRLDPRIAIGTALITQVFGVGSSVWSHGRKRWIDYPLGAQLLIVTVPLALVGAHLAGSIPTDLLKSIFGMGLLAIGVMFLRTPSQEPMNTPSHDIASNQISHRLGGMLLCGTGGLFMGLIGTGQGAMNGVYLLRRRQMPSQVVVATSVFVIAITGLAASSGYLLTFVRAGGDVLTQVLNLALYTVPGVVIGGQIAPHISARLDKQKMERLLAIIFLFIGGLTLWTTWNEIH
ncbi:MAG: sulfite exporter TauE/SafE family protein [Chloroflexi bacterium]|nr:sulfite exporter TauE/SafE family protein [Chloroflexota bacterium]